LPHSATAGQICFDVQNGSEHVLKEVRFTRGTALAFSINQEDL